MTPGVPPRLPSGALVGLDLGASLLKGVVTGPDLGPSFGEFGEFGSFLAAAADLPALTNLLRTGDARVSATGAGASRLEAALQGACDVRLVPEFTAWRAGERSLLARSGVRPTDPHLLVSLGTGTSIFRVSERGAFTRAGGTALGGGTLRGLGELLLRESNAVRLFALASAGDSRSVDLLVGDLYPPGEIALMPGLTAANFGKVASREPADVAAALVRLVGENVALLAGAFARADGPRTDVVWAGTTLRGNPLLAQIIQETSALAGARAVFLPHGEFTGAVGALLAD